MRYFTYVTDMRQGTSKVGAQTNRQLAITQAYAMSRYLSKDVTEVVVEDLHNFEDGVILRLRPNSEGVLRNVLE